MFVWRNLKAFILVLFVMLSEVIYLPFSNIPHHEGVSLGIVLYNFLAQVGYISFLPSIFLYLNETKKDSKGIYLGLVVWNVLEVIQELDCMLKWNITFLNKTSSPTSDYMQILFIIFVIMLTYLAYKKKCFISYLYHLLPRHLCIFTCIGKILKRKYMRLKKLEK